MDKQKIVACLKSKLEKDVEEYAGEIIARELTNRRKQIGAFIKAYLNTPEGVTMMRACAIDSIRSIMEDSGILDAISITELNRLTKHAVMNLFKPEVQEHITGKK